MNILPIKSDIFCKKVANFIEKSPKSQRVLEKVNKNPALFNAGYTALLAITLKPASIIYLAVKTKDGKEDGKYGACKSISTGILDFLVALAIFTPVNRGLDKVGNKLFNEASTVYFKNKEMCANYKSIMNRIIKIATLPIFAWMKFALLEPTVNLFFGKNKK